ncbi:MAG: hypothetical protein IKR57_00825 [Bacilli bacterium]|nr:hypothetical protein [Bacilli bacterium]
MKKVLKDNLFLFKIALIALLIIILDHYFPSAFKYILIGILVCILLYILGIFVYKYIIKKVIRNIRIKKVSKKDIKVLDSYLNYKFDSELLIDNELDDYIDFVKYLIKDFKEMEKDIHYKKEEMEEDLKNSSKFKNRTIKEYIKKSKEALDIIYKYYDDTGIRII